jgi:hypothetical protein
MFTDSERILLLALVVCGFVQVGKACIPLLNGWMAVLVTVALSALGVLIVFGFDMKWNTLAVIALIFLAAAGVHGTATKVSDYPSPLENPTPSGTPAQNYKVHVE